MAISDLFSLIESGDKLYMQGQEKPVINDTSKVGWFAIPEQELPPEEMVEGELGNMEPMPRTVGELKLTHFKADELDDILNAKNVVELTKEVNELKGKVTALERLSGMSS